MEITSKDTIAHRLERLREWMRYERMGAFIFLTGDPHQSEYTADHWKGRQWVSGFDGSAGTAVVTSTSAALWTDSRYFLAAEEQLRGTEFLLMRQKVEGTPTIAEWLGNYLRENSGYTEVGIDGTICSVSIARNLIADLRSHGGFTLRTNIDPLQQLWTDRPPIPLDKVFVYPESLAGESTCSKIKRIRQALRRQHADGMLMASLDDIAWTLNLRGSDIHCNPVFISYLLISTTSVTLFINKEKLSLETKAYLDANHIRVDDYEHVEQGLYDYFEYNILMDPEEVNVDLFTGKWRNDRGSRNVEVIEAPSPVPAMKAIKNATEIEGFHRAMERDGVAMVKFLRWLDQPNKTYRTYESHESYETELSVSRQLEMLRSQQSLYRGPSFDTIAAYGPHGAIVHYEPTDESNAPLQPEGLLLLDSGAQYEDGTTDITRTIAMGPLTEEMRRAYTLVLKGHLQLQNLHFPDGACGTQLDAVARMAMWREGYNYLHGTGHGVGAFLNVHEGPHQIRMEYRGALLHAGMTVTDEPGIYLTGRFGVRIENTLLVVPAGETECGRFLRFEPLTLCPIDMRPVVPEMLTPDECHWLDTYHQMVYDRLSPYLTPEETVWLRKATAPVKDALNKKN